MGCRINPKPALMPRWAQTAEHIVLARIVMDLYPEADELRCGKGYRLNFASGWYIPARDMFGDRVFVLASPAFSRWQARAAETGKLRHELRSFLSFIRIIPTRIYACGETAIGPSALRIIEGASHAERL
jgi:hypothetical protein